MRSFVVWFPRTTVAVAALGLAVSSAALAVTAHPVAAGAAPQPAQSGNVATFATKSSTVAVEGRGNGHGHGMSQYGAQGAALAGLSSSQIVAFYYPGTTLTTLPDSTIRVSISGAGSATTVSGTTTGISVTTYGALPSGYELFRLTPSGSGFALDGQTTSGTWHRLSTSLPARADFSSSVGYVRLFFTDGSSTRYRGTVGAVRNGSGLITINRTSLDNYTMGVVPREMPSSWRAAAVGAQAIAARTYGRNAVESHGSSLYDICDTTSCQVYGGMRHYSSGGTELWDDDPAAIVGNENMVLRYDGNTIFAQFSASNGGSMLTGGLPYLVNKTDPYDNAASGDPYLGWTDSVSASSIASYYGLQSVSSVEVTQRNGYGPWGGWVLQATVSGTTWSDSTTHISTTGNSLASAMGVRTAYFQIGGAATVPGAPQSVSATSDDSGAQVSWSPPDWSTVTSYRLSWGRHELNVPATTHSAYVSPIWQTVDQTVWVQAVNSYGVGPAGRVTVRGKPQPQGLASISPYRLFDTRKNPAQVTRDHPFTFDMAGQGSISPDATTVQFSLTISDETALGHLDVYVAGAPATPAVWVPYHAGQLVTTTVSVRLHPSSTLVFKPSAGAVSIMAEQESYTASWGHKVRPVPPTWQHTISNVGTDGSATISLDGAPMVDANTSMVLIGVRAWFHTESAYLRIWPDDRTQPKVVHTVTAAYGPGANMLFMRLPASHRLRIMANKPGVSARVTLLGLVGDGGGRFESLPSMPIADDSVASRPSVLVGTDTSYVPIRGVGPTPATGVSAVLVEIRLTATAGAGQLWAWPSGTTRPKSTVIVSAAHRSQVATALVMVGNNGMIDLRGTTDGLKVSLTSLGYLTSS
jgi:stage II sporulation protein D